jgi:hypothetical protein
MKISKYDLDILAAIRRNPENIHRRYQLYRISSDALMAAKKTRSYAGVSPDDATVAEMADSGPRPQRRGIGSEKGGTLPRSSCSGLFWIWMIRVRVLDS